MDRYKPMPPAGLLDEPYTPPPYSFISFEGFLNAKLLVRILEAVGPKLRQSELRAAAESLDKIDLGINVPVSFGPQRHQGLNRVYCTVASDGRFVPLSDAEWLRWQR
jgi:hypothetical protein